MRQADRKIRQQDARWQLRGTYGGTDSVARCFQEINSSRKLDDRTKTDTGGWEEDSQARERTLVKELGKLSS
jgi:hypothetical protein